MVWPHGKDSEEIVKEVYVSESEGSNLRGRPLGKWRDKVKEYKCEGGKGREGGLEWAMRVFGQGEVEAVLLWPLPRAGVGTAGMHDGCGMPIHDGCGMPKTCFWHAKAQVTFFLRGFLPFLWDSNRLPLGCHFRCSGP